MIAEGKYKKVVERIQADGINTIQDLVEKKNEINDDLNRIKMELNEDEFDEVVRRAIKTHEKYSIKFEHLFESIFNKVAH